MIRSRWNHLQRRDYSALTVFLLGAAVVLVSAWLRLYALPPRLTNVALGLPLLICLFIRDRALLYGLMVSLSALVVLQLEWNEGLPGSQGTIDVVDLTVMLLNIWMVGGALVAWLRQSDSARGLTGQLKAASDALFASNSDLERSNAQLDELNAELRERERKILRQNDDLRQQAEELENQAQELEQRSTELYEANGELFRRERALRTLLESVRWLRNDLSEGDAMNAVCQAAVQVLSQHAFGAAVATVENGRIVVKGHSGFGTSGPSVADMDPAMSLATAVMKDECPIAVSDARLRPDLKMLRPGIGRAPLSAIAAPVWVGGRPEAVLEVYSHTPKDWTEHHFRLVEWLAAQAGLGLQTIRSYRELEIRRQRAEELSREKTRFLAAVSHDVRTPVNAICLMADVITRAAEREECSPAVGKLAFDLKSAARSLVDLVGNILDLSRLDSEHLVINQSEFSLSELLEEVCGQASPMAEAKYLSLCKEVPDDGVVLRTDRVKLGRVLTNLIGNAIKFTSVGEVRVRCERTDAGAVTLSVIDTGMGIPAEHLPRIFQEFVQLGNPERDNTKGNGLGLTICKRLLDALGCGVSVESRVGIGSTFTVNIPSECVVSQPQADPQAHPRPALPFGPLLDGNSGALDDTLLSGRRILVVEDHGLTRGALARLLRERGASVWEAESGGKALELYPGTAPEVVLLDLMLPDMDGSDVLARLKSEYPQDRSAILVITGDVAAGRKEDLLRLGASRVLAKPLTVEAVCEAIKQASLKGAAVELPCGVVAGSDGRPVERGAGSELPSSSSPLGLSPSAATVPTP